MDRHNKYKKPLKNRTRRQAQKESQAIEYKQYQKNTSNVARHERYTPQIKSRAQNKTRFKL
jgi:hypothetical protein